MNKTLDEATNLIESMASHNFSWSNERAMHTPQQTMHQLSSPNAVAAKLESLQRQITQLMTERNGSAIVASTSSSHSCLICGDFGHLPQECILYAGSENQISEVNYAQNQGPYSQSYNPS